MKTIFSLCFLSLLSFAKLLAQNNLPPVYEINADTSAYETIDDHYWQVLEDSKGKWEIGQVDQSPVVDLFHATDTRTNKIDYSIHFYWLRYRLRNNMNKEAKICLTNETNADQSDFFINDKTNNWIHYTTGTLYPDSKKDGLKKINSIPVTIKPGEELIIYNRLKNFYFFNKPIHLWVSLGSTDKIIQQYYINNQSNYFRTILDSLVAGILIFACFYNFFLFSISKDKVYLYFSLWIFYFLFSSFFPYLTDVFFPESPALLLCVSAVCYSTGLLFYVQFIRYFFKTFLSHPKWDILLNITSIISTIAFLIAFLIEPFLQGKWNNAANNIAQLIFDLGLFFVLRVFIIFLPRANTSSRLMLISALPSLCIWAFGFTLMNIYFFMAERFGANTPGFINWLANNFIYFNYASVSWLVIIFSRILFLKYIQLESDNKQKELEKERLLKEIEIERNQLIEQQKMELEKTVAERTAELKHSLENLQSTQKQLIQSEKMASLGELTAGIAHEIQNPLNFVNNFSEVSNELIDEMKEGLSNGDYEDVNALADDIKQNLEKINHHGKRADAIVKGMLQHSRSSTGTKEPTNINALADEYLRLAYHGLRAKDNSFNAIMKTDFDETIGNINIIPQDIGRVLLNLYNNAFYAVNEKGKSAIANYQPEVEIETRKMENRISITVCDNGNGIPQKAIDKIFQPFFTTKPTGQGTGLGLSLSYDIVKAHGGEIQVESKEGEGTEFVILLPIV